MCIEDKDALIVNMFFKLSVNLLYFSVNDNYRHYLPRQGARGLPMKGVVKLCQSGTHAVILCFIKVYTVVCINS